MTYQKSGIFKIHETVNGKEIYEQFYIAAFEQGSTVENFKEACAESKEKVEEFKELAKKALRKYIESNDAGEPKYDLRYNKNSEISYVSNQKPVNFNTSYLSKIGYTEENKEYYFMIQIIDYSINERIEK